MMGRGVQRGTSTWARGLWLALCATALIARAEVLTPLEPVSPDGFEVVCDRELTATGAAVVHRAPQVFFVIPAQGVREVRLMAPGEQPRVLKVGPPATSVSLQLTPPRPVKNRDREAELSITVDGASAPPVVRSNVGRVEALERVGEGHFRARYVLPETRYPEVAIIVAFAAWPHAQSIHGAVGVLRVPLASAVDLPGKVEAGAELRLSLAGQTFGPVLAGADGSFLLPVVVPPGYGVAQGHTRDPAGNTRITRIDLMLPPTDQLACVSTPSHVPADGASRARILCASSDPFGGVARGVTVTLGASAGKLSAPRALGNGLEEWTWTAPVDRGPGFATFEASWTGGGFESRESLAIELGQSPVSKVRLIEPDEPVVHLGSTWRARVQGLDARGRAVQQAVFAATASADGPLRTTAGAEDTLELSWTPAGPPGLATITVRAWGPLSSEPARLAIWGEGGHVHAAVTDLSGLPVPGQRLGLGDATVITGEDGLVDLGVLPDGPSELRHLDWKALTSRLVIGRGELRYPLTQGPPMAMLRREVQVAPPVPVDVRLTREDGGFVWWLEHPDGSLADGREVLITADGVRRPATSSGKQRVECLQLTVVDVSSQVAAAGVAR